MRALTQGVAATSGASSGAAPLPGGGPLAPGGDAAASAFPSLRPLDGAGAPTVGASAVATATGGSAGGSSGWSLTELVHAVTIMCAYHSLCSVVQALGICRYVAAAEVEGATLRDAVLGTATAGKWVDVT